MTVRLWDVEHPYHCAPGNWYGPPAECEQQWDSWDAFYEEYGEPDGDGRDDNEVIWRWDWEDLTDSDEGDLGISLHLFMVGQRRAVYRSHEITVTKADEPRIREYLLRHWKTIQELWAPFSEAKP